MAAHNDETEQMPVVRTLAEFDRNSGNALERLVFNHRRVMLAVCAVLTVVLGFAAATKLTLNASFEKMIPQSQAYIKNYLTYQKDLRGLGNSLRIVVENTDGDIFDPAYLETLKQINDELVVTPGVDRAWVKSLWMPAVRWTEVTEEGFRGGPVMPPTLRRLGRRRRATEAERRARGYFRNARRRRPPLVGDLPAAPRQGPADRRPHRLSRPVARPRGQ